MVQHFFHQSSSTFSYIVFDPETKDAVIIDPCLEFDPVAFTLSDQPVVPVVQFVADHKLRVRWILETHVHADHVTGAQVLKRRYPDAKVGISKAITKVQETFAKIYGDGAILKEPFAQYFEDGQKIQAGSMEIKVIATPGHTPACVAYLTPFGLFTGDAIFQPRSGTGRCDFPGGDSRALYSSIKKIYELPESTPIFVGHDYPPKDERPKAETSVGEQKINNIHIRAETRETEFVTFREARDKTLSLPKLFYASLYFNIRGGELPAKNAQGIRVMPIPIFASF